MKSADNTKLEEDQTVVQTELDDIKMQTIEIKIILIVQTSNKSFCNKLGVYHLEIEEEERNFCVY